MDPTERVVDDSANAGCSLGPIGEMLWLSPLQPLKRPAWAPRVGYTPLFFGKARTGHRVLWIFGGEHNGRYTNDVWRSVNGGSSWALVPAGDRWSPRIRTNVAGGSTAPLPNPQAVIYIVGGQGSSGPCSDVWASDTLCKTWYCMNRRAPFGPRLDASCIVMPSDPQTLLVAGGVSTDLHRDIWISRDLGATFSEVTVPELPSSFTLVSFPPNFLCVSYSPQQERLGVWRLLIDGLDGPCSTVDAKQFQSQLSPGVQPTTWSAELSPLDDFTATEFDGWMNFQFDYMTTFQHSPRVALDLQAGNLITWDARQNCLMVYWLQQQHASPQWPTRYSKLCLADCKVGHIYCDMDSLQFSTRKGRLVVFTEGGVTQSPLWASRQTQLKAQVRYMLLLGLRLHVLHGLPREVWSGRVLKMILPSVQGVPEHGIQ